ncbi:hypothetical protein [Streptomyces afghaniensis]|uniref:hypothetical protein n=1 Tax=Streptomyces afghaniensis TaxID=66865 RepID=UPI003798F2F0
MTVASDDAAERTAEGIAAVCAHVEEIRADLRDGSHGDAGPLERVLAAARAGEDIADLLDALHIALQADGDALGLNGYADGGGAGTRGIRAAGISAADPGETVYLCPGGRCVRYWWPSGDTPVPRCAISGDVLRRDWL